MKLSVSMNDQTKPIQPVSAATPRGTRGHQGTASFADSVFDTFPL
jgi:hypothetical protein